MNTLQKVILLLAVLIIPLLAGPGTGTLQIFPVDNWWNWDISNHNVDPQSDAVIAEIKKYEAGLGNSLPARNQTELHPDFNSTIYGIDYAVGISSTPVPINIISWSGSTCITSTSGGETDYGPAPIPLNTPVEGYNPLPGSYANPHKYDSPGIVGDKHVIYINSSTKMLYELYDAVPQPAGAATHWEASCYIKWDLTKNERRPLGETSVDAAGFAVFPGLVRYEDITRGAMNHAARCTFNFTPRKYIWPATHFASTTGDTHNDAANFLLPQFGQKFRIKASIDLVGRGLTGQALIIANGLKKYGMMNADNGSSWYISGEPNAGWNDTDLNTLKKIKDVDFELVQTVDAGGNPIYPTGGSTSTNTGSVNPLTDVKAYPNPFDPSLTTVKLAYVPPSPGLKMKVTNSAGEIVRESTNVLTWDGKDASGIIVPKGIYYINIMDTAGNKKNMKVALVK